MFKIVYFTKYITNTAFLNSQGIYYYLFTDEESDSMVLFLVHADYYYHHII